MKLVQVVVITGALIGWSVSLMACSVGLVIPVQPAPLLATPTANIVGTATPLPSSTATFIAPTAAPLNPLTIESMREREYPDSEITIEQTLTPGANYHRYIASYMSDGLKINALLTVPNGTKPKSGWPVIVFNHGYIPPALYRTTERYVAYVDTIARAGYIVFRSDYRGHGSSQGQALGGYGTPDYTIDVLNAVSSIKHYRDADPNRIGMWGHSMGGQMTFRAMVISHDIKAGVIWSGVVASYPDMLAQWHWPPRNEPTPTNGRHWREDLISQYGTPEENPAFWNSISPNSYLKDLSGPIQLHHSMTDPEVPVLFSQELDQQIRAAGKVSELYTYPSDDHNLSKNFSIAMQRSIVFFDKYVKKGG